MASRRDQIRMSADEALQFLRVETKGVLATNVPRGFPHQVTVNYAPRDGGVVAMSSFAKAQKVVNLRRSPVASLLVERAEIYREFQGVLLCGSVEIVSALDIVVAVMHEQNAAAARAAGDPGDLPPVDIERVAPKRVAMLLTVERMVSWDHRKLNGVY